MTKPKEKKCKGIGQAKGYGCGKMTAHRVYGLGKMCCYGSWLYTSDAGKVKLQKAIIKVTKPRLELEKAATEKKDRNKIGNLLKSTKDTCHRYIRLRDKYKPCASCNTEWHPDFQAGHLFKSELFSLLRFDERNINGQCIECNIRLEGNESAYRIGLLRRYGKAHLDSLDEIAEKEKKTVQKWNRAELEAIRSYYNDKIKLLQRETAA